jgi:hypothetical protein
MILRYTLASLLVLAFVVSAESATYYYVAKSLSTNKCSVTTKKPDNKKAMDVGMMMFTTKADADKAMKSSPDCK